METQVSSYRVRFSKQIRGWLSEVFPSELAGLSSVLSTSSFQDQKFISDYLATTLISKESAALDEGQLQLPVMHCLFLLSLTPRAHFENPKLKNAVDIVRQEKFVREKWKQVSRIECLVFQAVLRAQSNVTAADRDWLNGFIDSWRAAQSEKTLELV